MQAKPALAELAVHIDCTISLAQLGIVKGAPTWVAWVPPLISDKGPFKGKCSMFA